MIYKETGDGRVVACVTAAGSGKLDFVSQAIFFELDGVTVGLGGGVERERAGGLATLLLDSMVQAAAEATAADTQSTLAWSYVGKNRRDRHGPLVTKVEFSSNGGGKGWGRVLGSLRSNIEMMSGGRVIHEFGLTFEDTSRGLSERLARMTAALAEGIVFGDGMDEGAEAKRRPRL